MFVKYNILKDKKNKKDLKPKITIQTSYGKLFRQVSFSGGPGRSCNILVANTFSAKINSFVLNAKINSFLKLYGFFTKENKLENLSGEISCFTLKRIWRFFVYTDAVIFN